MFEVVGSIDPPALPLWAGLIVAVLLYPIGLMIGAPCSTCCCRNDSCEGFDLEEAFNSGDAGTQYCVLYTPGPSLLALQFTSPCFGEGAAGTVEGHGEDVGASPLVSVAVTDGGSGYAKYGNAAPTLTLTNAATTAATCTVTLTAKQDACKIDYWQVASLSVTNGGNGYTSGDPVTVSLADGDVADTNVNATITTTRAKPTLSATAPHGSGATFSVSLTSNADSPETWRVSSVTFSGASYAYVYGDTLSFSGDNVTVASPATVTVKTVRTQPTLSATTSSGGSATLSVVMESAGSTPPTWRVASVTVSNGGTGYPDSGTVSFTFGENTFEDSAASAEYSATDGVITTVSVTDGGSYYHDAGQIDSLSIDSGGAYYLDGVLSGITVIDGGKYYHPDASLTPYVRPPTVTVVQQSPSAGAGAAITAMVESDTGSENFGKVTSLTLDNAGHDYLAWKYVSDFEYLGDGKFAFAAFTQTEGHGMWQMTINKGCWVKDGKGYTAKVVHVGWETPTHVEWAAKTGCCTIHLTQQKCRTEYTGGYASEFCDGDIETTTSRSISTSQGCIDEFNRLSGLVGSRGRWDGRLGRGRYKLLSVDSHEWDECHDCNGNDAGRGKTSYTLGSGRWVATVEPPPTGEVTCLKFCGYRQKCGPYPRTPLYLDSGYGSYGADDPHDGVRRTCVRWICRCYEGTGKKNQYNEETGEHVYPDPADWYTVKSTSAEIGGPPVFGAGLASKLEAATNTTHYYTDYDSIEHDWLFGPFNAWPAEENTVFCVVWAFVFYGFSGQNPPILCETPAVNQPRVVTPRDIYTIHPCARCS